MKKQKMISLTGEENRKSHKKQKVCYICKKEFNHKVKVHCHYTGNYRGTAHSISTLRYKTPKEIPVVFHIGSTYDYHFISKS